MNIARIKDGTVINIEIADQEWVNLNEGVDGFTFVSYDPELEVPHIGFKWTKENGFEQPPLIEGEGHDHDHLDDEIGAILAGK